VQAEQALARNEPRKIRSEHGMLLKRKKKKRHREKDETEGKFFDWLLVR
jgi:hypothetical protein